MKSIQKSYFYLLIALVLASCGTQESKNEQETDGVQALNAPESAFQKMELGMGQKPAWKSHWATVLGDFSVEDFEWMFTDSIDPMEMPEKNPILENDPLFPYQLPHPEGNGTMDVYSYKVEAQDGLDKPYLNPDSEVIWYRADGMKERLLFIGPSGMFEEGLWLSPSEFLVMGYFQEEEGFRPMIWLINTDSHQLSQYKLNKTSTSYTPESYLNKKLKSVDLSSNGN